MHLIATLLSLLIVNSSFGNNTNVVLPQDLNSEVIQATVEYDQDGNPQEDRKYIRNTALPFITNGVCPEGSIIDNPPDGGWAYPSSEDAETITYQTYSNPDGLLASGIIFWAVQAYFDGSWNECSSDQMDFSIAFYENNNGLPGEEIHSEIHTLDAVIDSDVAFGDFTVYRFTGVLDAPLFADDAWVAIYSLNNPQCWSMIISSEGGSGQGGFYNSSGAWEIRQEPLALCISAPSAQSGTPAPPENFAAIAGEHGLLETYLSWENPQITVDGDPITEPFSVYVYRNDTLKFSVEEAAAGAEESWTDLNIQHAGYYQYSVYAENTAGQGPVVNSTVFVGEDVPAAPSNIQLSASSDGGFVTWEAPTEGLSGHYFTGEDLTYRVIRFPGNVAVATGVTETEFTDHNLPGFADYHYSVTASNSSGEGGTGFSNEEILGLDDLLLYEDFNEEGVFPPSGWYHVNGITNAHWHQTDMYSYSGDFSARSRLGVNTGNQADEWLVTPAIDMNNPLAEVLFFYGFSGGAPNGVREKVRILAVDQPYDNTTDLHANAVLLEELFFENEWTGYAVDLTALEGDMHLVFNYYLTEEDNSIFNSVSVDRVWVGESIEIELTIQEPDGAGSVTPEPGVYQYSDYEIVTLLAEPHHTTYFEHWLVNGEVFSDETETELFLTEDAEVQAVFLSDGFYTLTVEEPAGQGYTVPGTGDHYYLIDEVTTVVARADSGWAFSHWDGDVADSYSPITTITMDDNHSVKANFISFNGVDLPYYEDFTGVPQGKIPANWSRDLNNWAVRETNLAGGVAPEMRFNWWPGNDGLFGLRSPRINTEGLDFLRLSFKHHLVNLDSQPSYSVRLVSIADGDEFLIKEWTNPQDIGPEEVEFFLSTLSHGVGTNEFFLEWQFDGNSFETNAWYLDDIELVEETNMFYVSIAVMEDNPDQTIIPEATVIVNDREYFVNDSGIALFGLHDGFEYEAFVEARGYIDENVQISVNGDDIAFDVFMKHDIQNPFNLAVDTENYSPDEALLSWNEWEFRYDDGVVYTQFGYPLGSQNSVIGAVHPNHAEIDRISWKLTEEGGPHDEVKVWVLGLRHDGVPDRHNIIYTAEGVPNVDNEWVSYEFTEELDLPEGFYIGLSFDGFLGLAADNGTGEPWDFVPGTQFGISDINNPTFEFRDIQIFGHQVNFLLRAYGQNFGYIEFDKQLPVSRNIEDPKPIQIKADREFHSDALKNPTISGFLGYNIYLNNELVEEQVMDTEFLFSELPGGVHSAGVQSVYTTGVSEIVLIDFDVEGVEPDTFTANFYVLDEEENSINDAVITLDGVQFDAGVYTFYDLLPATYQYIVNCEGYYEKTGNFEITADDVDVYITLIEEEEEPDIFSVRFLLDMSSAEGFEPGIHNVFISGGFGESNDWIEPGAEQDLRLTLYEDPNIYKVDLLFEPGTYEYKYYSDAFGYGWDGAEWSDDLSNRIVVVEEDMEVFDEWAELITGINDGEDSELLLYPNPSRDNLNVVSSVKILKVVVTNVHGQEVYLDYVNGNEVVIKTSAFKNGLYFIKIYANDLIETHQFIIQK